MVANDEFFHYFCHILFCDEIHYKHISHLPALFVFEER